MERRGLIVLWLLGEPQFIATRLITAMITKLYRHLRKIKFDRVVKLKRG